MNGRSLSAFRFLLRSLVVRRSLSITALLAFTVAAAVSTALLNLYFDVEAKLTREFRNFGANALVVAAKSTSISAPDLQRLRAALPAGSQFAGFAFIVAETGDRQPVVVAGYEPAARTMNAWWKLSPPSSGNGILIGKRAAESLGNGALELTYSGKSLTLAPSQILETGADEENRIYLPMADFTAWTGLSPQTVELSIPGDASQVIATLSRLQLALPHLHIQPVRQIVEAEMKVLSRSRAIVFASTALIVLLVSLCVLATLTATVLERRRDFALMKALGSSQAGINLMFVAEAAILGAAGALLGFIIGCGLSMWIGQVNFHAPVAVRWQVFPYVMLGALATAAISALFPLSRLQRLEPAVMLKGD